MKTEVEGMNAPARRQYYVEHGLCPLCGNEAAPYYLCWDHRFRNSLRRVMNQFTARGLVTKNRNSGGNVYQVRPEFKGADGKPDREKIDRWSEQFTWASVDFGNMRKDDKRRRPRFGRQPVDLLPTLLQIFVDENRPLTEADIMCAWGKLRAKRTTPLATDMSKLIRAQWRRENRQAKRIA